MNIWEKTKVFIGLDDENFPLSPNGQEISDPGAARKNNRVISFPEVNQKKNAPNTKEVILIEPKVSEDSLTVASYLKNGNPVIVNIKHLDARTGKRFIDFICGSAYAFEGNMSRLGGTIFLFTPAEMPIVALDGTESEMNSDIPGEVEVYEDDVTLKFQEDNIDNFDEFEYLNETAKEALVS
jgi:cell division inhibitor SepF